MPYDDLDDEDWYDDDSEPDGEEAGRCPECGGVVFSVADRCPACGYWLSESDRRELFVSSAKPLWLRATAVVLLVAFLLSVLGIAAAIF